MGAWHNGASLVFGYTPHIDVIINFLSRVSDMGVFTPRCKQVQAWQKMFFRLDNNPETLGTGEYWVPIDLLKTACASNETVLSF
ncbi:hypothetical protein N9E91_05815 [Alphaproteobacteria bacterium]|jgi:hypothetical protein|nr:hypothetical protein [Alphaproteobacteria bacterium]